MLKNTRFKYQLTNWLPKEKLREAIRQIEKYEGQGKGYCLREDAGKWAIFTEGLYIDEGSEDNPYGISTEGEINILGCQELLRRARKG